MGFILKLNVDTGRDDLPKIRPLVTNGLVGGFVPALSLKDTTGNAKTLTKKGSPTITKYGIKGGGVNGYVTNIPETKSLTMTAVFRVHPSGSDYTVRAVGSEFSVSFGGTRGTNISTIPASGAVAIRSMSAALLDGTDMTQRSRTADSIPTGSPTEWVFAAIVVDAAANSLSDFTSVSKKLNSYSNASYDFSSRLLVGSDGVVNFNEIASNSQNQATTANVEVAEVLFYDRALSEQEILEQMGYSMMYVRDNLGITF